VSAINVTAGDSPLAATYPALRRDNITLAPGAGAGLKGLFAFMAGLGILLSIAAAVLRPGNISATHALAAVHVGTMACLAMSLGGLFFTMVFHLMNAGWSAALRRQCENLAMMVLPCVVILAVVLVIDALTGHPMFSWMGRHTGEYLLEKKAGYLNSVFFYIRFAFYAVVWIGLSRLMFYYGRRQDEVGGSQYAAKARFAASPGMLIFALTVAFGAFDLLKSLDYRFFSTMWGVYYFAGAAFSAAALLTLIFAVLRSAGKLERVVTEEHFHDLGKLMFSFTVFWAYIGFSQYFLIWYANIPEETAYYVHRKQGGIFDGNWNTISTLLVLGHFVLPFLLLINRAVKRSPRMLIAIALWMIFMEIIDMHWIIRPMVYLGMKPEEIPGVTGWWVDIAGIAGVVGVFGYFLVRRITSGPLVPLQDPRMGETLSHKNYV
jgi:hypothetical protein